jgi:hypothetical protein
MKDTRLIAGQILEDYYLPAIKAFEPGPLMQSIVEEMEQKRQADEAWLASLSPHARKVELTRRRIARLESRFCEALDFRRYDEY